MTYDLHIVNTNVKEDGFLIMSENVNPRYRQLMNDVYKAFYISKKKFPEGPGEVSFNETTQLWERIVKIKNFDNLHKARSFAFEWANRPPLSNRGRLNAKTQAGCTLDILIVDENGTIVQTISSDELYGRGGYASNKGENQPTNG